ncbi:MAG: peptidylprolyl isomerase [Planctomycetaceae bacterium]|nr:peptidylprolyl isomerase [Planctomycetaceae bacterium]
MKTLVSLFLVITFSAVVLFAQEAAKEPAKDAPAPPAAVVPSEPAKEPVKEPTKEPAKEPAADTESQYVQDEKAAVELGEKNKIFMEKFDTFGKTIAKLNALKIEFQSAKPERQIQIQDEYAKLHVEGKSLTKELLTVGLDAFDEAPNRNPFVSNFIYNLISWEFFRDNYDVSYNIFKQITDKGVDKSAAIYYVYGGYAALMTMNLDDAEKWLKIAKDNGDLKKFQDELSSSKTGQQQLDTLQSLEERLPEFRKNWAKELEVRKAEKEEGEKDAEKKLPRVELKTNKGTIVIELFENEAPNTVANFVSLVEKGFYNGVVFHRVLQMFMAQGGDPTGSGMGGPGYGIDCENKGANARKHFRGSLSMAHAGPNTGGSQFFLTFVPTYFLDRETRPPGHTVFGRVVEGIEVLAEIQRIDPLDEKRMMPPPDKIVEAKVLNKRNHEYAPIKNANR